MVSAAAPVPARLNMRISAQGKARLQAAADLVDKDLTSFVLDTVSPRAEEILREQNKIKLESDNWDELCAILDAPAKPNEALRKLMNTPAPWE